jgi:hypothetical protein
MEIASVLLIINYKSTYQRNVKVFKLNITSCQVRTYHSYLHKHASTSSSKKEKERGPTVKCKCHGFSNLQKGHSMIFSKENSLLY